MVASFIYAWISFQRSARKFDFLDARMSIAQPRFVEIKFTRKVDFWEASRALRAKKAPKYAIERYAQKRPLKYAIEP